MVRTLPIRVAPIEGEALDSWLEAIAHRTHTAFGDVLSAVALTTPCSDGAGTNAWVVRLNPDQGAAISEATGINEAMIYTMTLAHYSGRAVRIKPDTGTVSRAFPWGRGAGSRFCPGCLAESGGRWQLAWRLGWTFACTIHHCLLADACPHCGAVQRRRTHISGIIPEPARCAHPAADATGRSPARCHADLTVTPVASFDTEHPAIHAQRIVNAILDTETPKVGIYKSTRQPRINVLADIRAVAGRALAYATPRDLDAVIPADLIAAFRDANHHLKRRSGPARADAKPGLAAPARAATAALGVVAALRALDSTDIGSAGDALRWLVTSSRERGSAVHPANIAWGKNTSPVLAGVQLAALGPMLHASDQLRYRIGAPMPTHPTPGTSITVGLARRLPSMLWPAWSLSMSIPGCHQRQLRPALSIAMLLVHSRLKLDEAANLIDSSIDGPAASRVLQLLEKHDRWLSIRAGLIQMADYLHHHDIPIDYQGRRRLDYNRLLPDEVWAHICRDTATRGPQSRRARIARSFLYQRLTGLPGDDGPTVLNDSAFRTEVADFPQHLTPELNQALDEHALDFLADHDIVGEPVMWQPPADLLHGLDLPGPDLNAVDIGELHDLISGDRMKLGAAAARLHTTLDTIRYLLEIHPPPRSARPQRTQTTPTHSRAYCSAKAALPRDRLVELYQRQQMSLRDIATAVGVSRQTITCLARDYGLPLREAGRRARTTVDRDWLYDQYVIKRRALPDIAEEAGMSTANMARWAKTHAIPMRGRGGPSHTANLNAQSAVAEAPKAIRPTLAGIGGWERLQRFAAAARHPTLTVAAEALGVDQFTLVNQINRIERELGTRLLIRAERGRPMELTQDGVRVVATVRACQGKTCNYPE
ncbi:hypothetical protein LAUMK136_00063 [Mycobacterium attenuatum]|uniref:HTH lysR-type domain-containing protein n=1 Tax=Mycobacterium attenuatum TaxID=2341086 RepID=A0A498PN23_9MYCO|nr:TniQ family protein [Mycobacterium attenuatum]VBA31467.1 hypothetical protein LAUMK136_00063 [Mycobacterium attenuatum]